MASNSSSIEKEWGRVFMLCKVRDRINREGYAEITSEDFNKSLCDLGKGSGGSEIRLLNEYTKKPHPPGSVLHGLMVFPTSNRSWIIFKGKELELNFDLSDQNLRYPPSRTNLTRSEALWMGYPFTNGGQLKAYIQNGGIFNEIFEETDMVPSLEGKQRTGIKIPLEFNGITKYIDTDAGIEIDGSFEGDRSFVIAELKNDLVKTIPIKQLYIPYKMITEKFREEGINKKVFTALICASYNTLHIFIFKFGSNNPSSIECVGKYTYRIWKPPKEESVALTN